VDPSLIAVAICVLIGAALLIPLLLARRRAPQERGLVPALETYCSARGTNIPMFRLSIYDGFLVVASLKPTVIPFGQVAGAGVCGTAFGRRLRIETKGGATYDLAVGDMDRALLLLNDT
jgi:hypothetical protein